MSSINANSKLIAYDRLDYAVARFELLHSPHECGECRYYITPWMVCSRVGRSTPEEQISVDATYPTYKLITEQLINPGLAACSFINLFDNNRTIQAIAAVC